MNKKKLLSIGISVILILGIVGGVFIAKSHKSVNKEPEVKTGKTKDTTDYEKIYKVTEEQIAEAILTDEERADFTSRLEKMNVKKLSKTDRKDLKALATEVQDKFNASNEILETEMSTFAASIPQGTENYEADFLQKQYMILGEVATLKENEQYQSAYNMFLDIENAIKDYLLEHTGEEIVIVNQVEANTSSKPAANKNNTNTNTAASNTNGNNNAGSANVTGNTTVNNSNSNSANTGNTSSSNNTPTPTPTPTPSQPSTPTPAPSTPPSTPVSGSDSLAQQIVGELTYGPDGNLDAATKSRIRTYCNQVEAEYAASPESSTMDIFDWTAEHGYYAYSVYYTWIY